MTVQPMIAYMFCLELPPFSDEMAAAIPAQRLLVNRLFLEGTLLSYSVSASRDTIWCVVAAPGEQEAMETVAAFPMHPWFRDVAMHPLLFHNMMPNAPLPVSLN